MTMLLMREDLARMYPRALSEWLHAFARLGPVLAVHYKFTRLDWVHFCGQIDAETNGLSLKRMEENMRFRTAARILEVYNYRLGVALAREPALKAKHRTRGNLAKALINNPKELADLVYGGREGTPWRQGSKYIGRGPTQITHLDNYRAVGGEIARQPGGGAFDLVANPELLATDPELGIRAAFADWHLKNLTRWACADDCDTLSDALNTGNTKDSVKPHGLEARRKGTARAKKIWPMDIDFAASIAPEPEPAPADAETPPAPAITVARLAAVSRKARLVMRLKALGHAIWGSLSLATVMEYFGVAKGVLNEVTQFVSDHSLAIALTSAILLVLVARQIGRYLEDDVASGRYVPSGVAADAGAQPAAA